MLLENCKLQQQLDPTTYLLERLKSKTLISNAVEDMEQQELSLTDSGNAKWFRPYGRHFDNF